MLNAQCSLDTGDMTVNRQPTARSYSHVSTQCTHRFLYEGSSTQGKFCPKLRFTIWGKFYGSKIWGVHTEKVGSKFRRQFHPNCGWLSLRVSHLFQITFKPQGKLCFFTLFAPCYLAIRATGPARVVRMPCKHRVPFKVDRLRRHNK